MCVAVWCLAIGLAPLGGSALARRKDSGNAPRTLEGHVTSPELRSGKSLRLFFPFVALHLLALRSPPWAALRSIWSPSSPALQHCHRSGQGLDEAQSRPPPESTARAAWAWKERQRDGRRKGRPGARGTQVGPRGRGFRDEVTPAIVACLQAHGQCMSLPPCVAGGACRMSPPPPHRLAKDDPPTNAQRPPIYA